MEWAGFERIFGPITIQERIDWAAAEIVSTLSHRPMKETLLNWDDQPDFDPEARELANALKVEAVLQSAMRSG